MYPQILVRRHIFRAVFNTEQHSFTELYIKRNKKQFYRGNNLNKDVSYFLQALNDLFLKKENWKEFEIQVISTCQVIEKKKRSWWRT